MTKRTEIEKEIIQNFRLVFQAIQRHSKYVEKQLGISSSQLWAMTELSLQPGLRVSDIADRLSIKNATASNMLDKIQSKELVERKRENEDQRVVRIYLTDKGRDLLQQSNVPTQGAVLSGLGLMAAKDVVHLHSALNMLVDNMLTHENLSTKVPVEQLTK
jgi:DNA-binding MarR family transcriptional regulator